MDFLIGAVMGLWIVLTIGSVIVMANGVKDSDIHSKLKLSIYIYLVLGLFYVLEALVRLGFLFIDKI